MTQQVPSSIIIIGTGVFGISTAIALGRRYPGSKVQVFDRYEPPVLDSTSVDTTRCIRTDYSDLFYEKLSHESMELIKKDPELSKYYHESGMSVVYNGDKNDKWHTYFELEKASAERVTKDTPGKVVELKGPSGVFTSIHGASTKPQTEESLGRPSVWNEGYTNLNNGLIEADNSIKALYERAKTFPNISFTFKPVENIVYEDGTNKAKGIKLEDGTIVESEVVVVAAGAWSAKLVDLEGVTYSSAIEVAWYKVTEEEEEQWKNMAITTNLSTGINLFPPLNGEIKILRRSAGYKNTIEIPNPDPLAEKKTSSISFPRTIATYESDWIPEEAELALRENMKEIMPPLYKRPFIRTKLCWLTQTKNANFLIDYHPSLQNVVLATGGSAHGWKFVPILGDKVVDLLEGQLDPVLKEKWSWEEKIEGIKSLKGDSDSTSRIDGDVHELRDYVRTVS